MRDAARRWEWVADCSVCEQMLIRGIVRWGGCGRAMHRYQREGATPVDRDATRDIELGARAGAVAEASRAAAGERGGRPGGDVDKADARVHLVLRCIMGGHAE